MLSIMSEVYLTWNHFRPYFQKASCTANGLVRYIEGEDDLIEVEEEGGTGERYIGKLWARSGEVKV